MTFKETFERAARHRRRRLGPGRAAARGSARRRQRPARRSRFEGRRSSIGDEAPALYSIIRNPGAREGAAPASRQQGRDAFYSGDIAAAIVAKVQANGGVMTQGRPRRVPVRVGRADLDQLSRLRRLRAAAARPGLRGARDAEHPRGVRAEARHQPRDARAVGSDVLAPDGRGEEAGLRGSAGEERRSEVRRTCRSSELLSKAYAATLCGQIDPNVAVEAGASPAAPTAARSI